MRRVLAAQQRAVDAVAVAAVAQLAEELVDEVAAVGEDQDAAGARRLDEAEGGDGLAGAGGVLEPEALAGVGVLGRLGELLLVVVGGRLVVPVLRLLLLVVLGVLLAGDAGRGELDRGVGTRRCRCRSSTRWASASSAVSVPDSASTWCAERTVPSTSVGSSSPSRRSRPSSSENVRRQATRRVRRRRPRARPAPRRTRAAAASPGPSACATSSPSSTKGSRVNFCTRSRSVEDGRDAALSATAVESAIEARQSYVVDAARTVAPKGASGRGHDQPARVALRTPIEADRRPTLRCDAPGRYPSSPPLAVVAVVVIGLLQAVAAASRRSCRRSTSMQALRELAGRAGAAGRAARRSTTSSSTATSRRCAPRLRALRGHPVVVNKWGSWCVPCRQEFPIFQHAGAKLRQAGRVPRHRHGRHRSTPARAFLREFPVTYPSYRDPARRDRRRTSASPARTPVMLFLDAQGRTAFIHQGQYKTLAGLRGRHRALPARLGSHDVRSPRPPSCS